MSSIILKVEGKGNGIRTVIVNMAKVMKALERSVDVGMKFLGMELGATTRCETTDGKCIINGKYDESQINGALDKFIDTFVLCSKCGNPETELVVKGETAGKICKACGYRGKLPGESSLTKYIITNHVKNSSKNNKDSVGFPIISKSNVNTNDVNVEEWSLDTSSNAVRLREQKLKLGDDTAIIDSYSDVYPHTNFAEYLRGKESGWPEPEIVVNKLKRLITTQGMSNTVLLKYTFAGLFSVDIRTDFYRKIDYLVGLVETEKDQTVIMMCIEKFIEGNNCVSEIPHILNGFWESGCITEEVIIKWHKGKSKYIGEKLADNIRIQAQPFVVWLQSEKEITD